MTGTDLDDRELREAAAEVGLSPQELRIALTQELAPPTSALSRRRPSAHLSPLRPLEGRFAIAPARALTEVRASIERQTGRSGHRQGNDQVDIVDDEQGLTYRLRSRDDGSGGAIVRVDIDSSQGHGGQALSATGIIGVTSSLVALGYLFGTLSLLLGGLGFGILGGLVLIRSALKLRRATTAAQGTAAHALVEVEERATT